MFKKLEKKKKSKAGLFAKQTLDQEIKEKKRMKNVGDNEPYNPKELMRKVELPSAKVSGSPEPERRRP